MTIAPGSTNNTLLAVAFVADGQVVDDLAHDTAGISIYVQRIGEADGSPLTLSAKVGTTWAAGAFKNLTAGDISVDVPDSFFEDFTGQIRIVGTFTGGYVVGYWANVVAADQPQIAGLSYLQPGTTFVTTVDFGAPVTSPAATLKIGDASASSLAAPVQVGSTGQYEVTVVVPSGATFGEAGTVRVSGLIGGVERVIVLVGLVAEVTPDIGQDLLTILQGAEVTQVPSPNVSGNLSLVQGDTYDGVGNPKAQWVVTTDYTDGWSVTFTVRDEDDEVVYTTSGTVDSDTLVSVEIEAPTGLTMTGCPGVWQGKFDVQLSKGSSIKTIAVGTVYINEDQTR
jgi:hypothetical protein